MTDTTDGWGIMITAHADHTDAQIRAWARAIGIEIDPGPWDEDTGDDAERIIMAIARITPAILDAMRRDGEWTGTAGDDEHGITIDIDPGDVDLGGE